MKALLEGKPLFDILPQKAPMTMVHRLLEANEQQAISEFTVLPDNPFLENDSLALPGLIENIAQTVAARSGYLYSIQARDELSLSNPPIGFIGAITKLSLHHNPPVHSTIRTSIKIEAEISEVSLISGESYLNDQLLAACSMKVFLRK